MLKYPIYIRSVTNLSDARYCAGMGVEMLGFCFDPKSTDFIEPTIAMGIIGWLSGVKIVAEFGENTETEIKNLIKELQPDFISLNPSTYISDIEIPVIYKVDLADTIKTLPPINAYLLIENSGIELKNDLKNFIKAEVSESYQLIIATGFTKETIDEIQNTYLPYGFSLKGGKEIAPGLKDFDDLAEILEAIEY